MNDEFEIKNKNMEPVEPLVEEVDYYFEGGLMVLTGRYLLRRGFCCENRCRHCPYGFDSDRSK